MPATNKLLTTAQALQISNEIIDKVKNKGYALAADLGSVAALDEIAESNLASALATKINGKAEASDLTTVSGKVTTLIGSDASKSVRTIANEELAAQLIPQDAQEALDTLQEIAAWIQAHPADVAAINAKLTLGTHEVGGEQVQYATVKAYVEAYVADQISDAALSGSDAISISNDVVSLIIDTANANGLAITASGLKLTTATTSAAGAMSAADKTKLEGIEAEANKYVHPSYTATTGVETADQAPAFGGTFSVSQIASDATGHITGQTTRTVTIPNATATDSAAGLMSAADKSKLDNADVTAYTGTGAIDVTSHVISVSAATTSAAGTMSAADKTKLDDIEVASAADITALIAQLNSL